MSDDTDKTRALIQNLAKTRSGLGRIAQAMNTPTLVQIQMHSWAHHLVAEPEPFNEPAVHVHKEYGLEKVVELSQTMRRFRRKLVLQINQAFLTKAQFPNRLWTEPETFPNLAAALDAYEDQDLAQDNGVLLVGRAIAKQLETNDEHQGLETTTVGGHWWTRGRLGNFYTMQVRQGWSDLPAAWKGLHANQILLVPGNAGRFCENFDTNIWINQEPPIWHVDYKLCLDIDSSKTRSAQIKA